MSKVLIIAEAGVNHNGDMKIAFQLIDAAVEAKVDWIKFQTFKADKLVSKEARKSEYQIRNTGTKDESQYQMLKKLELSHEQHLELIAYCKTRNIRFFSTAFDLESLQYLSDLGFDYVKIPSGEITNLPYLKLAAILFDHVILSTGMASLDEIKEAVEVFLDAGLSKSAITILHCNTEYPTPMKDVNLKAMLEIQSVIGVDIGYSDHTLGIEVPIAAVALGAKVIEKHFTLDRRMEGPDHAASLEPDELKQMVRSIRNVEEAISGSGHKEPSPSEMKNIQIARKSIHIAASVPKGHVLKEGDLLILRPGTGISPMKINKIIGRKVKRDLTGGELLNEDDLE
ncbi:MAG: N-acetylneuraminate synthase [Fluviicola sp.]|jgi:N-acetylneuraminate synthase|uniref:N-acetylneuraminate synthase n=1 Tax=Fluviicola sp. TaxID=1917219 RepID=UPI0026022226|nr:N-acetylneuraminate synthase [Fluviicola sp.]MDF3027326.1 N-acetylneuraminate synthase [Fluviicola sp.]